MNESQLRQIIREELLKEVNKNPYAAVNSIRELQQIEKRLAKEFNVYRTFIKERTKELQDKKGTKLKQKSWEVPAYNPTAGH